MVEVVAFTGTFTDTGKHGITAVSLSDVVDEFHHVDGLADTGAAEQTDLAALGKRADKVNNLNAGFQQVNSRAQFVKLRSCTVNRTAFIFADGAAVIDRAAQHVHNTAESLVTDRNRNTCAGGLHFHAALQTVRRAHGNGTNHAVAQLLLHFESQACLGQGIGLVLFQDKCVVNLRHVVAGEFDIHHSADNLNDLSDTHGVILGIQIF